jgi:hypothetical protein
MFANPEQSRFSLLRGWVLDNAVTQITMSERQFWNLAGLQPAAEKPWTTFMGRPIFVSDMPMDAQKCLGVYDKQGPGVIWIVSASPHAKLSCVDVEGAEPIRKAFTQALIIPSVLRGLPPQSGTISDLLSWYFFDERWGFQIQTNAAPTFNFDCGCIDSLRWWFSNQVQPVPAAQYVTGKALSLLKSRTSFLLDRMPLRAFAMHKTRDCVARHLSSMNPYPGESHGLHH